MTTRRRVLGGLAAAGGWPATKVRSQTVSADAALDATFAAAAPPALAAGIVTREGLAWSGVRGVRRAGETDPATLQDRWHLGSNTKAMTAAVYGRLVEQGRARWMTPVAELFPDVSVDPAWGAATLETFLTHRAGLRDEAVIGRDWLMTARSDPRPLPEQRAAIAAAALSRPPTAAPGPFAYANANYILAGAAIERLTGGPWEDAMRTEMFQPLGLASAGFGPPDQGALGHRLIGGRAVPMDPVDPGADNPQALGPAGTVHMTLPDYARFIQAMLTGGSDWLKPETTATLTAPPEAGARSYALGWITLSGQPWAEGTVIAHEGTNTMWYAMVVADPAGGKGWIALSNDGAQGRTACQSMVQRLIMAG